MRAAARRGLQSRRSASRDSTPGGCCATSGGDPNPSTRIKLIWGAILGVLGLAMILSNSIAVIRQIIALSVNPFVFIVLLMIVCLPKALKTEKVASHG